MMKNAANVATARTTNALVPAPFYVAAEKRKVSNSNVYYKIIWHLTPELVKRKMKITRYDNLHLSFRS